MAIKLLSQFLIFFSENWEKIAFIFFQNIPIKYVHFQKKIMYKTTC